MDSIGARLRAARERAGLTTLQAASKLHLEPRLLEALEGDDFAVLGAPVYIRGHLKRYAELIGASSDELLDLYAKQEGAHQAPDITRVPQTPAAQAPRQLAGPVIAVIVAGTVIAGIWLALKGLPQASRPVAPTSATTTVPPAPAPAPAPAQAGTPVPEPESPPAIDPAAASAAQVAESLPAGPPGSLGLAFTAQSWVEVYDSRNARVSFGMGEPGTARSLGGTPPWRIVLGNVEGVSIRLDGREIEVPEGVRRGRTAHFRLATDGTVQGVP